MHYEAIRMLNVSATQELARRLEKLEMREEHVAELEHKAAWVSTLEREVADLKNMVTQLAEAGKGSKQTWPLTNHIKILPFGKASERPPRRLKQRRSVAPWLYSPAILLAHQSWNRYCGCSATRVPRLIECPAWMNV